jgi:hypothetical protein
MKGEKHYSDYVMLDVPDGCGELVVNSRQIGYICVDPNIMKKMAPKGERCP